MAEMKEWMKVIPEAELRVFQKAGFLAPLSFGERPALVVVDVTFGFTGSEGLTMEEAIAEFPTACGPSSWEAMPRISKLIDTFRARGLPVVYTHPELDNSDYVGRTTKSKSETERTQGFNEFPAMIAPRPDEFVLAKPKASAFFQSPLTAYLIRERIDTLVLCGVSTSGCVRASTVDAFSHGYTTFVVDECCFDRSHFMHSVHLFDLQAKYASVVSFAELEAMLGPVRKASAA